MHITSPKGLAVALAVAALFGATAEAQEQEFGFEDGVLDPFEGRGDAGISDENVLEGNFSAFITTGAGAVGEVCSFLLSPFIFPPTDEATVRVEFEVRYKTNEGTGPFAEFEDPFHTELVTGQGTVDVLTIKTDGIFFPGSRPRTVVFEEVEEGGEDVRLPRPPTIPFFAEGVFFGQETRELSVRSTLALTGCDPVRLKFDICDALDTIVDSAAFIDEVEFDFAPRGEQCPPADASSMGVEEFPAPRE
jgi:hypothetical protein